jgi:putative Mg2+ transporter-C (MgtC) family protein
MMPTITFGRFVAYTSEAFVLGSLIGAERQWRQRTAGLRTNALVALGAAAFVMVAGMTIAADHPLQIAAQVVSGIGFIGGGVIFREGLLVKGLNTAATLWCSAAVGVLCGSGFAKEAAVATVFVLLANVFLRPVARRLERAEPPALADVEIDYLIRLQCRSNDEGQLRALLLQNAYSPNLVLKSLLSEDIDTPGKLEIRAILVSSGRQDVALERIVNRLSLEPSVSAASWEVVGQSDDTE